MRSARMRAIASDGPPAANGTTMVIGCAGQVSAETLPVNDNIASTARTSFRITRSPQSSLSYHF
ncbi:hypothetical protein ACVWW1_002029 [Bradyrhizobium sp. JR3.5]